jgi:hypothetical protein
MTCGAISESENQQRPPHEPKPPSIWRNFVLGLDEAEKPAKAKGIISQGEIRRFA